MKRSPVQILLLLLALCFLPTCEKDEMDLSLSGFESKYDAELYIAEDPCDGMTIFGPQDFLRTTAKPIAVHRVFEISEAADVCLTITNNGVSAAWILINGEEVFSPKDFKHNKTSLQLVTSLQKGSHDITIKSTGKPGGTITLELKGNISDPPPPVKCSDLAKMDCESRGWQVVAVYISEGILYCTIDGRAIENNCDTCGVYNVYVWKDGAREMRCVEDGWPDYLSTQAGQVYAGHTPCDCGDNLAYCGSWNMQDCIPD